MEDILEFLLSDLNDTVRGLMAFHDMVTPDAKDYLPFVSEEEQKKLHAEVKWSDRYKKKFKFAPQISEGKLKIYLNRLPGRRAWLCPVYDEKGELVRRIYFDDADVPICEIADAFAVIQSPYRQRRWTKQEYDETARRILEEGADPEEEIEKLVTKQLEERPSTEKRKKQEDLARKRIRAALRRRGAV